MTDLDPGHPTETAILGAIGTDALFAEEILARLCLDASPEGVTTIKSRMRRLDETGLVCLRHGLYSLTAVAKGQLPGAAA